MTPDAFGHPAHDLDLVETHISWLILAGDFAYKVKKPLKLDFLDFSDLDKRRHFCEEEVRLNRPFAPDIYLDVVPITLRNGRAVVGGDGEAVEYAVRMRRFDQSLRLDNQLDAGELSVDDMKELGATIAARHAQAQRVASKERSRVLRLTREFMLDNLVALEEVIDEATIPPLSEWTLQELDRHAPLLARRFDEDKVRDCHGDLHLGNLVRLPGGITTFDCIEFSPDLRHIDVMCDVAFLVMDLAARHRQDLAAHFLNRYLESTGDFEGITLLSLFFVYRCLVRAKVAAIRSGERDSPLERSHDLDEARSYCEMALRQCRTRRPILVLMHGLSGSGKTWVSGQLMAALPAIRIRSDIERKRLFGIDESASSASPVGGGIYSRASSEQVYAHMVDAARTVLASGHDVILDAAFLDSAARQRALRLASDLDLAAVIVDIRAPDALLRRRLARRAEGRGDVSEADAAVLDYQLSRAGGLTAAEQPFTVVCTNDGAVDMQRLVEDVRNGARRLQS